MTSTEVSANDQDPDSQLNKSFKCVYCNIEAIDFGRLKCHLAGAGGAVFPCSRAPVVVKQIFRDELLGNRKDDLTLPMKRTYMDTVVPDPSQVHLLGNEKCVKIESRDNSGIESIMSKDYSFSREVKKCIAKFFYESGLDINAVNLPSFQKMISMCSGQIKHQIPTPLELNGFIFDNTLKEMHDYVSSIKSSWADTGCSILLDGWTDKRGRNLINILVGCPKGTVYLHSSDISDFVGNTDAMRLFLEKVVTEVGIKNVVQIITYSTSAFMKEVGKVLTEKHRSIFWTVCASSCIELMLEKLGEMDLIKETLEKTKKLANVIYRDPVTLKFLHENTDAQDLFKPSKIRSIIPFLTLENILLAKETIKKIFLSSEEETSIVGGEKVAQLVADRSFWSGASTVVNAAIPLVRVIELMNENRKPDMGYIYETIDQAKETIKEQFKHKKSPYKLYWEVIDDVWNEHLHSPLHSAAFFLNPSLFYSSQVFIDPEVATGLFCCIVRSTEDLRVQDRITVQLEQYRMAKGDFRVGWDVNKRSNIAPELWWSKYGGQCPELQALAVRVLSQSCVGASKFQLERGLAETFLRKELNPMEQQRLAEMIFLRYNMQLQNFASGGTHYLSPGKMDSIDDWPVDRALEVVPHDGNLLGMEMDGGDAPDQGAVVPSSRRKRKS